VKEIEVFEIGGLPPPIAPRAAPAAPKPVSFDSRIVGQFPPLLTEFNGKPFTLLWRGSRDGFRASDFHSRCAGHANTLTLIQDTKGNIFGGFTPLAWESFVPKTLTGAAFRPDPSQRSFLFTLKNPRDLAPRRFPLITKQKRPYAAIACSVHLGPHFRNLGIEANCNTSSYNISDFCLGDNGYANDSGVDGETILTGSTRFTVKEIEVFEIAGLPLPTNTAAFESRIVDQFPALFTEFRGKP
jgi:hypothetical protein